MRWLKRLLVMTFVAAVPAAGRAVILNGTGDPLHNTTAPGGSLTNSGWQYQGFWGAFLGTPISSRHFLAARHVGGSVGDTFVFGGIGYVTTAVYDDPGSDLRIWRVCGSFPDYAPLFDGVTEVGQPCVVFGRGTQRGTPVMISQLLGEETKGWLWGNYDGVERWGTNVINAVVNGSVIEPLLGPVGDLLEATFDAGGGIDEAHLSTGDSSGGLFIRTGGVWKLAGINFAVEAQFNTNSTGPGFYAAITDKGGLYSGGEGNWQLTPDLLADLPSAFYATRVASNLPWIRSILDGPAPAEPPPRLEFATTVSGGYQMDNNAVLDAAARTFTLAQPAQNRFFRLNGCVTNRIADIFLSGTNVVIRYE
ncbi:MAG: hypothetical protein QOF48_3484 [Verrucomicrobiota bacterium]|jgi:hypothetical protein